MNILHSIILGLVEGATEFLPVSSTAHLILTSTYLHLQQTSFVSMFEVVIQSGAILAVVFLYWERLMKDKKLVTLVMLSFIPTAIIGFLLHDVIKNVFFKSQDLIVFMLALVGFVFVIVEYMFDKNNISLKKEAESLTYKDAIAIGIFQSFAIVPGVSRAGAVILGMMLLKYKRKFAAEYSFILAIPTILAASVLDVAKFNGSLSSQEIMVLAMGFGTAFLSALLFIKWFISYVERHNLIIFGLYRIILAAFVTLFP